MKIIDTHTKQKNHGQLDTKQVNSPARTICRPGRDGGGAPEERCNKSWTYLQSKHDGHTQTENLYVRTYSTQRR